MRFPYSPLQFLLFLLLLAVLFAMMQIGLIGIAAEKLGISLSTALLGLLVCLIGSVINIPLFEIRSSAPTSQPPAPLWLIGGRRPRHDHILVAINLGGAIMPLLFCLYLLASYRISITQLTLVTLGVGIISYGLSRPVPRLGIAMPVLIPPLSAALLALLINPGQSAPLAYIGGTLGVILGADLMRLRDIRLLGAPIVSIGGAGTFDGVFLTGIIAVLLA